jgi:hypothetical protein
MSTVITNSGPFVRFIRDEYKKFYKANPIIRDGMFVIVTNLPWYKSWFGLRPTRMLLGDGKTRFRNLRFL